MTCRVPIHDVEGISSSSASGARAAQVRTPIRAATLLEAKQELAVTSVDGARTLRVVHFQRKPRPGNFSIERLFDRIRQAMPASVQCSAHVCPFLSDGMVPRLRNVLDAARHQSQINHVTGDVHYLTLGLVPSRTLLTIHDCAPLERLRGLRRLLLKWFWYDLPIRRSALVHVISESARRELLRYVRCDQRKIRVIHNCVGPEFVPSPKSFNSARPEILHLGTKPNKNLERLARALEGLPCRLHVIGVLTPAQAALLQQCNIRYSNIPRATDAELLEAYHNCDMVAFISTYEGFGLPIVEANAIGRPVVTSNVLSLPEVAGNAACLVDPSNIQSIRNGIMRVSQNTGYRQTLVMVGFDNVKRFSPATIAARYAALYREIYEAEAKAVKTRSRPPGNFSSR